MWCQTLNFDKNICAWQPLNLFFLKSYPITRDVGEGMVGFESDQNPWPLEGVALTVLSIIRSCWISYWTLNSLRSPTPPKEWKKYKQLFPTIYELLLCNLISVMERKLLIEESIPTLFDCFVFNKIDSGERLIKCSLDHHIQGTWTSESERTILLTYISIPILKNGYTL